MTCEHPDCNEAGLYRAVMEFHLKDSDRSVCGSKVSEVELLEFRVCGEHRQDAERAFLTLPQVKRALSDPRGVQMEVEWSLALLH